MTEIQKHLFTLQDTQYRDFMAKLIPNVDKESVIGIRTPALKAYAKELKKEPYTERFLNELPHKYFEENNLHSYLLNSIKPFDCAVEKVEAFLPYIDNWATCDGLSPTVFRKNAEALLAYIERWLNSDHTYTVRFGVKCLMSYFLDKEFDEKYLERVSTIRSQEYYVNMMIAWYFATALAKQYEATVPYIEARRLERWTHNKAIQKAVESYRVSDAQKAYLRTLRWK